MNASDRHGDDGVKLLQQDEAGRGRAAFAAISPGGCCWICERPLPKYPQAALVERFDFDCFFLVCSEACGAVVAAELAATSSVTVKLLAGADAFARLLEASERIVFVVPGRKDVE